ncbi:hypothetical protein [Terribacillus saccharophilus]
MKNRKRGRKWMLLFRTEDGNRVYVYEPLQKGELNSRLRQGWRLIKQ